MFSEDCFYISPEWNVELLVLRENAYTTEPKLIHFTEYYKPWNQSLPQKRSFLYSDLFWEYAAKTSNYAEILEIAQKNFEP